MAPDPRCSRRFRASSLLTLLLFLPTGCGFWRTVPVSSVTSGDVPVNGEELRFRLPSDPRLWHLQVERVEPPFVEGLAWAEALTWSQAAGVEGSADAAPPAVRRLDLRSLELVEVETPGRGLAVTSGIVQGVLAAVYAAVALVVIDSLSFQRTAADRPTP